MVKGPFSIKWGDNVIDEVEEVDFEYEVDEEEYDTIQGKVVTVDGSHKASVTLTLLDSDIPALAALLPQHFIPNGQQMSTGETVNNANGAIDIAPLNCEVSDVFNHLDVIACGTPADVVRIVNARTRIDSIEIDNKVRKVMVKVIGQAEQNEASVQFFKQGTINTIS